MSKILGKLPNLPSSSLAMRNLTGTQSLDIKMSLPNDYAHRVQADPTILVEDAANYRDKNYVKAMADLFLTVAKATMIPLEELKKVRISNMELALSKLAKEQRYEYKDLCKVWGVVPEEHRSKKTTAGVNPEPHLRRLSSWGYFEMYFPNMTDIVQKIAAKTSFSGEMSDIDKAKYASIYVLFLSTQCLMPYDDEHVDTVWRQVKESDRQISVFDVKESVFAYEMQNEKAAKWSANMLYHFYSHYMEKLEDGAIDIDRIIYFLDLVDDEYKLTIKEYVELLSQDERSYFRTKGCTSLKTNLEIREFKEKLFPHGVWNSNGNLFLTTISSKQRTSYRYAFNRFKKNGYRFGENVETVMVPYDCKHVFSKEQYFMPDYLYCWSPLNVRVSDPNELWMMKGM